jgi:hypothetical protein
MSTAILKAVRLDAFSKKKMSYAILIALIMAALSK